MTGVNAAEPETSEEILNTLSVVLAQSRGMSKPTLLRQQVDNLYQQYVIAKRLELTPPITGE